MAGTQDERTPLLQNGGADAAVPHACPAPGSPKPAAKAALFGPANRILLAGFLMAFTLGITQVPILYVVRQMECEVFYSRPHPSPGLRLLAGLLPTGGVPDRCGRPEVDAGTAVQYSLLGMTTSFSGVLNLFLCAYLIKLAGARRAFVSQAAMMGLRVSSQMVAVTVGGRAGILIFQAFQLVGIVGGPRGYQLVLNTSVGDVVAPRQRTAVFGQLQGSIMIGTAIGYLLGGVLGDVYNIRRPFEVAFFLYIATSAYGALFLPESRDADEKNGRKAGAGSGAGASDFFAPLRVIVPHRYRLADGRVITNYGVIFLALGIFIGTFASGYAPLLLQMYATTAFHFNTTENGWLMFGNSLIRGLFLLFAFPRIISAGRRWWSGDGKIVEQREQEQEERDQQQRRQRREQQERLYASQLEAVEDSTDVLPPCPPESDSEVPQEPVAPPAHDENENDDDDDGDEGSGAGTGFDLFFVRWSLVVDAVVTTLAGLSARPWHVYAAAFLLPLASGSAPAVKGVLTDMCPASQRSDALGAITMVESAAMLTTQGVFGLIFAAFAEMGRPGLTFFCNAAMAVVGFMNLFFARFPPPDGKRIDGDEDEDDASESCTEPNPLRDAEGQ